MHKRTTPQVFEYVKELRHDLTPLERKLWARLCAHRMKGIHFRAQHAIGNYVVDFCAARKKLVELDGSQHLGQTEYYDEIRTEFLKSRGYKVIRFWNNNVSNNRERGSLYRTICNASPE